ncbi:hypothetical protein MP638_005123 [Amoeboaphelidium occidentale]|nr:hypothetical protein MP638_005123 [Amoeboaphelidium occidentale]
MDLDLNMRVDENEMPKTFTTDGFLSMSMVEYSGVAVDVGDLGGIGPSAGGKKRKEPEGGKRCKCGITEHQKISNKECPLYKPRLKLVDQPFDRTERTVTTSTGLNSVLRIAPLNDIIMDANRPIPDLRFSDGIMREFYQAVCSIDALRNPHQHKIVSTPSINEYMAEVYSRCRPDNLAWNDATKLAQLISNMARMHSTNCQNHVVTNLLKWIKKWLIWKLGKQLRAFLSADDFNEDGVDLDLNMRVDENEMPKTFYTDEFLSMNLVEHSGVEVDVGNSSGIRPSVGGKKRKEPEGGKRCKCGSTEHQRISNKNCPLIYEHKNTFHLLRVEDGVDLDLNMRVDENEMPKTFYTDEFLSMNLVEHSGVEVDVGNSSGIRPSVGGKKRKEPEGGKRCKCGSTERQRISNKNCPLYKPRLKLLYRDTELPEKTVTTITGLNSHSGVEVDVGNSSGIRPSVGGKKRKEPEGGKRCKCGSTEHQRISNKNYTELPEKPVTTTTGLNSVLRNAPLNDIIMDAVARCTDIQVEVSRLLNGYVIWMIEENRPIPDLRFSDGIMTEFYQAVYSIDAVRNPHQHKIVSTPSINEYMDEIYSRCRPDHLAWNDATKLTQLISNMARMHSKNCQNYVVTNLLKWIKIWLILKLGKQLRAFLSADDFNQVVTVAMNEITRTKENEEFYAIPLNIIEAVTPEQLNLIYDRINHYYEKLTIILNNQPLDEDSIKGSWWTYLKPISRLLNTFVNNYEQDAQNRLENGIHGRGLRLFSLTPISTFKQKFILIDTDALHDLMTSENIGIVVPRDKVVFRVHAMEWWRRAFNKWLIWKRGKQLRAFLCADDFNEVVTVAMNEITRTEEDEGFYAIPLNIIEAVTPEQLNLIYDRINHYYEKLRITLNNQPLDEDSLKASWWTYLKPMSRLLKTFVNNYKQDAQNRLENGIHGRGLRLFSLTPIKDEGFYAIPLNIIEAVTPEQLNLIYDRINHYYEKLRITLNNQPLDEDSLKASWWTYLKPMSRLLKTFVNNYKQDAQNRLENGIHGRGLRLFSLTPISTFKQKFILIDTDALHDLMTSENIGIVNRPIPDLRFSDGIMREFYQAVCSIDALRNPHQHKIVSTPSINEYMDEIYSSCRPDHLAWNDATKLAQLSSNMARMHSTNYQNHVVTNLLKWIKKWLIWKLGKQLRAFLSADDFNEVITVAMNEITRTEEDEGFYAIPLNIIEAVTPEQLNLIYDRINHYYEKMRIILNNQPLDEDSLKASWWTYLKPMSRLLKTFVITVAMNDITRTEEDEGFYAIPLNIIEAVTPEQLNLIYDRINHYYEKLRIILNNQPLNEDSLKASWWTYLKPMSRLLKTFVKNYEQDAQNRLENGIHGRGLRLFSLTPISAFKQKFILIDTDALHDLMTSENIGIVVPRDKVVFRLNAMEWWRRAFNVDKLTTDTKRFGFSVSTNGVKYHQHNMKQFERSEINDWGYNYEGEFIPLEINGQTRVVALDPGRNSLYVAVAGNTAADVLESDRDRHMAITLTTTPCCYNTDDYITHLLHVLEYRDEFLGFYRDMRWRRLRWKTRIKRQKAYDTLYKELAAGGLDNVVIAYGGGKFIHNSRGHPPTPNKHLFLELKRRTSCRLVPEFRTSKLCSLCDNELVQSDIWSIKNVVIAYGGGGFSHNSRGHPPTPNKHRFLELKRRTRRRLVPEFRTSKLCSLCDNELVQSDIWSIKSCNNNNCWTRWNRDVNGARNIRRVAFHMNANGGEKPEAFRRGN